MPSISRARQSKAATAFINTLIHSRFFGEVIFKFEAGNIVHIKQTRSSKIEDEAMRLLAGSIPLTMGGDGDLNAGIATGDSGVSPE